MVVIPIRLFNATRSKTIPFVTIHRTCNTRLRHRRWCEFHSEFVEQDEVSRGYEYERGQYLLMDAADFEGLPVSSTHTVDITKFVSLQDIDPIYYQRSYWLEPEAIGQKPYYLLKRALEKTGRVAIATVSIQQKEHVCCVRPSDNGLLMSTMVHSDEIAGVDGLEMGDGDAAVSDAEVDMAVALIDQLTGEFDPDEHEDEYRVALEGRIEAKLAGAEPTVVAAAPATGQVVDLMAALRSSIEATRQRGAGSDGAAEQQEPASASG
jgi:DNA end-binding protein Ku